MDPVRQGQRAAWTIFAVALGVYVLAAIVIRLTQTDPDCQAQQNCGMLAFTRALYLAMVAVGIGFLGLLAASSKSQELPPESRKAFWLTGLLCMALSGLLWFSICAGGMR
jgi:hypothetical protein